MPLTIWGGKGASLLLLGDWFLGELFGFVALGLLVLEGAFLVAHAAPPVVQVFVLPLREARRLVVHQELLRDGLPLLLLGEPIDPAMDTAVVHHCADAEVLRQLRTVVVPVEALREDLVPHLDGFQVHFELLCELDFGHVAPGLARVLLAFLLSLLLVKSDAVERLDMLCVDRDFARCEQRMVLKECLGLPSPSFFDILGCNLVSLGLCEEGALLFAVVSARGHRLRGEDLAQTLRQALFHRFSD